MPSQQKLPERIALFSDFGEAGPYTGQMEAVLLQRGVRIPIIRLMSDAPRCDPRAAAYLLAPLSNHLPDNTLFLAVVDPGVGGSRLPLLLQTERHWFIGPDNGLFSQVLNRARSVTVQAVDLHPANLSASFHGRDLFAPAAAVVSLGGRISLLPLEPSELIGSDWRDCLREVIYIDHYGNAFTGIRADEIGDDAQLSVGGVNIGKARTFSDEDMGRPFWYCNSIGLVEIAVNLGRAERLLRLTIGSLIKVI